MGFVGRKGSEDGDVVGARVFFEKAAGGGEFVLVLGEDEEFAGHTGGENFGKGLEKKGKGCLGRW